MVTTLRTTPVRPAPGAVAEHLAPLLELVFSGAPPVRFECWDGSSIGPADAPRVTPVREWDIAAMRRSRASWSESVGITNGTTPVWLPS